MLLFYALDLSILRPGAITDALNITLYTSTLYLLLILFIAGDVIEEKSKETAKNDFVPFPDDGVYLHCIEKTKTD